MDSQSTTSTAWAYIGSANCTESAWGKLSKDKSSKSAKLSCRNWECGVIIPIRAMTDRGFNIDAEAAGSEDGLAVFEGVMPLPMEYPAEEYSARKPWFHLEQPRRGSQID